jgi:hypothetical protein
MDGFGWFNNFGEFEVTVRSSTAGVPDPASTLLLLAVGLAGVLGLNRTVR